MWCHKDALGRLDRLTASGSSDALVRSLARHAGQVQVADGYRGGHLEAGTARQLGGMLSGEGRQYMEAKPSLALLPGLALATVTYGVNMFGDAVRDLLDPRLRGG